MTTYFTYFLDPVGLVEAEWEMEFGNDQQAVNAAFTAPSPWSADQLLGLFTAKARAPSGYGRMCGGRPSRMKRREASDCELVFSPDARSLGPRRS